MRITVFALALVISGLCLAQEKVAYVNMEKAFEDYYKTSNANVIFEQKKAEYEDKMLILSKELEADAKELQSLEGDAKNELLAKEARDEAVRKLRARAEVFNGKRDEFERSRRVGVQELTRTKSESEDMLVKELMVAIKQFAADKGYTLVYDVSGLTMNRMPVLLVYPEQLDVTSAFVAVINAGHDKELADAKAKLEAFSKKDAAKAE